MTRLYTLVDDAFAIITAQGKSAVMGKIDLKDAFCSDI